MATRHGNGIASHPFSVFLASQLALRSADAAPPEAVIARATSGNRKLLAVANRTAEGRGYQTANHQHKATIARASPLGWRLR